MHLACEWVNATQFGCPELVNSIGTCWLSLFCSLLGGFCSLFCGSCGDELQPGRCSGEAEQGASHQYRICSSGSELLWRWLREASRSSVILEQITCHTCQLHIGSYCRESPLWLQLLQHRTALEILPEVQTSPWQRNKASDTWQVSHTCLGIFSPEQHTKCHLNWNFQTTGAGAVRKSASTASIYWSAPMVLCYWLMKKQAVKFRHSICTNCLEKNSFYV